MLRKRWRNNKPRDQPESKTKKSTERLIDSNPSYDTYIYIYFIKLFLSNLSSHPLLSLSIKNPFHFRLHNMVKFNMLLVEILTVLFLIMSLLAPEASCRVLYGEKQNLLAGGLQVQAQVRPKPNPPTTSDIHILSSTTTQKAFTSDHFNDVVSPFFRRQLLKGSVPPSAPNPGTNNPASITSHSNTFIP